jgi:hypothetical protein
MKSEKLVVAPTLREVIQKLFLADDGMLVGLGGQVRPQVGASIPPDFFVGFTTSSHFQGVSLPF